MIKNERQYRITKSQIARFKSALADVAARNASSRQAATLLEIAQEDALRSQLSDLLAEVAEYEALRSGKVRRFQAETIDEIPAALIRARIATGMSQRDLAAKLGLKEQQVQRYEATAYASASFDRLRAIVNVLGVKVREDFSLTAKLP
jgi:ribosome-binding protein aMBF1 (putative translation factor)